MDLAAPSQDGSEIPGKPKIIIDLGEVPGPCLRAATSLRSLRATASHHVALDRRHPLGIYNVSTSRILKKLRACCENLEAYHHAASTMQGLGPHGRLADELIDYLELTMYAAAEHVDDIEAIAESFFPDGRACRTSAAVKRLKAAMKPIRDRITSFTNAIKHKHCRIRLFSCDFQQHGNAVCLHGFFIEQFHGGVIGPSPLFHGDGERIISITSFLWSTLFYLYEMSDALHEYLVAIDARPDEPTEANERSSPLKDVLVALVRLPLYAFDDVHPFRHTALIVRADEEHHPMLSSNIYGSISRQWVRSLEGTFGAFRLAYEGDGTSRSFNMAQPSRLQLEHWTQTKNLHDAARPAPPNGDPSEARLTRYVPPPPPHARRGTPQSS